MIRLRAETEQLREAAARLTEEAGALQAMGSTLGAQGPALAGEFGQLSQILASVHRAAAQAGELSDGAVQLGRSLLQSASALEDANTWRPVGNYASSTPSTDIDAMLARVAKTPQWQAVLAHTFKAEGMSGATAAHGGVVYQNNAGDLVSDRQWLNFGIISFALPGGTARDVLRRTLADPAEAAALRTSLIAHLQAQPGGTVDDAHRHLLRTGDPTIQPLSPEEQADQFIGRVQTGSDEALADWVFKYANVPSVHRGVVSGDLKPEWHDALGEFLGRPASVEAQIAITQREYADKALAEATQFHLHSVRSVAWFFDQHVQSGGPTDAMQAMIQDHPPHDSALAALWADYQAASSDRERLAILTELAGAPGSTVYQRRSEILNAAGLSDDPFSS